MASFNYSARGISGNPVKGALDAPSAEAAASQLRNKGLTQIKVSEAGQKGAAGSFFLPSLGPPVKTEEMVLFCRQMGTLLKAGVPIVRALKGMVEMTENKVFARMLTEVVEDLETGKEFSVALAQHPKAFSSLIVSMVQVGESSGGLDEAFWQIGQYLAREKETTDQVKSALRYPTFVMIAMAMALAVITLFVVPAFEKIFAGAGAELPLATRILLGTSAFAVAFWPYILGGLGGAFFGFRRYVKTEKGSVVWGRIKLRLPLVGHIILRATLTRFARSLAMGNGAGVPLVMALRLTGQAVDNAYVCSKVEEMCGSIERGEALTRSAANTKLFTPLVLQMLSVGEETGRVDQMLVDVADFYEREVDHDLKGLTGAIEPILVLFMGGMVLTLALGVFLPMWDLSSAMR